MTETNISMKKCPGMLLAFGFKKFSWNTRLLVSIQIQAGTFYYFFEISFP